MTPDHCGNAASSCLVELTSPQPRPTGPAELARRAGVRLRLATHADCETLAQIHLAALPTEFLPRLGGAFLRRVFFPTLIYSPHARVYVAEDDAGVAGLLVTRVGLGGAVGEMIAAAPVAFAWTFALALLRRPSLVMDCFGVFSQLLSRKGDTSGDALGELFLLCVHERARRRGVARALIEHSAEQMRAAGVETYRVMLHADNEAAHATYRKCGFIETRIHRFGSVFFSEYDRELAPRRSRAAAGSPRYGVIPPPSNATHTDETPSKGAVAWA